MKRSYVLLITSLLTYTCVAQTINSKKCSITKNHFGKRSELLKNKLNLPKSSLKATRATDRRMIAQWGFDNFGGTYFVDTTNYNYSSGRGSKFLLDDSMYGFIQPLDFYYEITTQDDENVLQSGSHPILTNITVENNTKLMNTYNTSNQLIEQLEMQWNGSTWDDYYKTIYTYDANGNLILKLRKSWDSGASAWLDTDNDIYTYSNNKVTSAKTEFFNGTSWEKVSEIYNDYDMSNHLVRDSSLYTYNSGTNSYENRYVETITYGTNSFTSTNKSWKLWLNSYRPDDKFVANLLGNKFTDGKYFEYDTLASAFKTIPTNLDSAFYGSNNLISKYISVETAGIGAETVDYTYNTQNQCTQALTNQFGSQYKSDYQYDSYNKMINDKYSENDGINWNVRTDKHYYYETYTPAGIEDIKEINKASLFPNPSSAQSYLSFYAASQYESIIQLCDITGKVIYSINEKASIGDHMVKLPMIGLANGLYFVSIYANNQLQSTLKLQKQND
jgi:hypothetical protein